MANRRIRSKQIKSHKRTVKTLEGYEEFLLQEMKKWLDIFNEKTPRGSSEALRHYNYYKRTHEELRNFYFDI